MQSKPDLFKHTDQPWYKPDLYVCTGPKKVKLQTPMR